MNVLSNTKKVIFIIFIISFCFYTLHSQELYKFDSKEKHSIVANGKMLLTSKHGDHISLQIKEADGGVVNVDEINSKEIIRISENLDRSKMTYTYQEMESQKKVCKIFDFESGKKILVDDSRGDVTTADISKSDTKILYQLRVKGESPRTIIYDYISEQRVDLGYGMGGTWSYDGQFFYTKALSKMNVNPNEQYRAGKISKQEYQNLMKNRKANKKPNPIRHIIYNKYNNIAFEITGFKDVSHISWSPISYDILVRDKQMGIFILKLKKNNDKLSLLKQTFVIRNEGNKDIGYPKWSFDGQKIAFEIFTLNASNSDYENSDVFVYFLDDSTIVNLTDTPNSFEKEPYWISKNKILIEGNGNYKKYKTIR